MKSCFRSTQEELRAGEANIEVHKILSPNDTTIFRQKVLAIFPTWSLLHLNNHIACRIYAPLSIYFRNFHKT